jgi:uncharacterized membrane protein
MKKKMNEKIKCYIVIVILGLILGSPLLVKGLPITHDGIYHVTRAMGTVEAILEGQIPPLVTSSFANGFGYSWNLFYPPVSTYAIVILRIASSSYVNALKLLVILTIIFSGLTMFNMMKEITKSDKISLLSAILYMVAPYRLLDIYTRMAIGEIVSFVFIPIIFEACIIYFKVMDVKIIF